MTRRKNSSKPFASDSSEDKPKRGRPGLKPTDAERMLVEQMVAVGIPLADIASVIRGGISEDTLKRHFPDEIREARIKANAKVGGVLFRKAVQGDTAAAIFWAKTRMGWKETRVNEHRAVGKISTEIMSPEEWQAQFVDQDEKSENLH